MPLSNGALSLPAFTRHAILNRMRMMIRASDRRRSTITSGGAKVHRFRHHPVLRSLQLVLQAIDTPLCLTQSLGRLFANIAVPNGHKYA